ncbi:hypothetical protein EDB89DRAFT_1905095 [Lactarius sanguifluus]|nr:hypothetical protein EDB89DRAFT_1905095 [Lactarius sanguifluus]
MPLLWYSAQIKSLSFFSVLYYYRVSEGIIKFFRDRRQNKAKTLSGGRISELENSDKHLSMDVYKKNHLSGRSANPIRSQDHELGGFVTGTSGLYEFEALATHYTLLAVSPGPTNYDASLPRSIIRHGTFDKKGDWALPAFVPTVLQDVITHSRDTGAGSRREGWASHRKASRDACTQFVKEIIQLLAAQWAFTSKLPKSCNQELGPQCLKALHHIPGAIRDLLVPPPESLEIIDEVRDTPNDDAALSVRYGLGVTSLLVSVTPLANVTVGIYLIASEQIRRTRYHGMITVLTSAWRCMLGLGLIFSVLVPYDYPVLLRANDLESLLPNSLQFAAASCLHFFSLDSRVRGADRWALCKMVPGLPGTNNFFSISQDPRIGAGLQMSMCSNGQKSAATKASAQKS